MASVMSAFELNSDSTHAAANPNAAKKIPIHGKKTAAPDLSKGRRDLTPP
jgi:hypothetical protein